MIDSGNFSLQIWPLMAFSLIKIRKIIDQKTFLDFWNLLCNENILPIFPFVMVWDFFSRGGAVFQSNCQSNLCKIYVGDVIFLSETEAYFSFSLLFINFSNWFFGGIFLWYIVQIYIYIVHVTLFLEPPEGSEKYFLSYLGYGLKNGV